MRTKWSNTHIQLKTITAKLWNREKGSFSFSHFKFSAIKAEVQLEYLSVLFPSSIYQELQKSIMQVITLTILVCLAAFAAAQGGGWGGDGHGDNHHHHTNYKFEYGVKDGHTKDHHEQWEHGNGDSVKGLSINFLLFLQ